MLFCAVLHGNKRPQSRQSARLFLQASEFGTPHPPHPLISRGVCPPLWFREGVTLACGAGGGGPNSGTGDRQCGTLGIYCMYFVQTYLYTA